jgi:maltose alpha-D-glucosyltransferase / alpha-amylase
VDLQAAKTRYHGDYHLGQVLLAENDFIIVDFEGEPARPLEERRAKHSPLRDVAGMLRSFNYAAYAVLRQITSERPDDSVLLEPIVQAWERFAVNAFLCGYRESISECPSYPIDSGHASALIDLFTLEKAFYELRYELENRPDWVAIPLKGLHRLLNKI